VAHLLAHWLDSEELLRKLDGTPQLLEKAWQCDWSIAVEKLLHAVNLFVVARGFGLGIAQEAALKLKETCGLHAEAFSSAEVVHGPMALVRPGFPVLMFTQRDDTRAGIEELAGEFAGRGAQVLIAGAQAQGVITLPIVAAHPVIEPLLTIQSFYRMAESLARARGLDPDHPPHLRKVTETL
jgi:glucosamine--fructose-6-phosphate aminotransferase (isomerizing)